MILAIDPGRDTGWAILDDNGVLVDAGLGKPLSTYVGPVIIERPQIYPGRGTRVNPNDLITLAIQVGEYTEFFRSRGCAIEHVLPHCWKGSVDPDVLCRRIVAALPSAEASRLDSCISNVPKSKQHNVIDAVGIAKWSVLRSRGGVFARR